MTWVNPPPQVVSMREVLAATAAFTSRNYTGAQVHYPSIEPEEVPHPIVPAIPPDTEPVEITWPAFALALDSSKQMRIIVIAPIGTLNVGQMQALAMELKAQVPSRYRMAAGGLVVADDPDIGEVGEPSEGMIAADDDTNAIEITCQIGLDLGA
jgi:hypothetical protein